MTEERERPATEGAAPSRPPRTGFIHLKDPDEMRVVLVWEVEVHRGWSQAFGNWPAKPLSFRARDRHDKLRQTYRGMRAAYFHPEVAERLLGSGRDGDDAPLGADNRRSLELHKLVDHRDKDNKRVLRIGALEALRVSNGDGAGTAILVVHAVVPRTYVERLPGEPADDEQTDGEHSEGAHADEDSQEPPDERSYERFYDAVRHPSRVVGICETINKLLARPDVCGPARVTLAAEHTARKSWFSAPLFTLTWVPREVSRRWIPEFGETPESLGARLEVPVGSEPLDDLRQAMAGRTSSARLPLPVLTAAGWQWGSLPSPTGFELGEERYSRAKKNIHVLSQSWAVSVWERGAAYLPRQDDGFLLEAMLKMCSTDLDVYLLVVLDRLRVRALSLSLAATAQELRVATEKIGPSGNLDVATKYLDPVIARAIRLDGEAVSFLASEWWIDVTRHRQADMVLAWMQQAGGLDRAVEQTVQQARLLQESVQTLIERQEHVADKERQERDRRREKLEREQQDSARAMEWAVGILAFVGLPLSVVLEVWSNLHDGGPLLRGAAWWGAGVGLLVVAMAVAWALAKWFDVRLWPPPGHNRRAVGDRGRAAVGGRVPGIGSRRRVDGGRGFLRRRRATVGESMITIIHPVGQGELGTDIVELQRDERLHAQEARQKELRQQVAEADAEVLSNRLLNIPPDEGGRPGRFKRTPLALVLEALRGRGAVVRVILLGTANGREGTETDVEAALLEQAYNRPDVKARLEEYFGLALQVEAYQHGDLFERKCVDDLHRWLDDDGAITDGKVIVSGIAGANAVVFAVMGLADQMGLDWRLAVAPEEGEKRAVFLERAANRVAPFYWLRSLGYPKQASDWAETTGAASALPTGEQQATEALAAALDRARYGDDREPGALAALAVTDMARADHGAGLALRAWVERRYRSLYGKERELAEQKGDKPRPPLRFVKANGRPKMLGEVVADAAAEAVRLGEDCPGSTAWLASAGPLNDLAKRTVHDGQAPHAEDWAVVEGEPALLEALPKWVTRPGRRPVLYIFGCGRSFRSPTIPERVLRAEPERELRRAVPGALLERDAFAAGPDGHPALPVEFVILHSAHPESRKTAWLNAQTVVADGVHREWELPEPGWSFLDYGEGDSGARAVPEAMWTVRERVGAVLAQQMPSAVVIVGTGEKSAVYGALEGAQEWCALNAVPLFVQTFVDKGRGIKEPASQFHRIALRNDAEEALRRAAAISLRSLNLLSAVRVLAAGDRDMDALAEKCEELRQEYVQARQAERLDDHAGVIVDVLRTVRLLFDEADWLTQARLVVAAAEAVHARRLSKRGQSLLQEPDTLLNKEKVAERKKAGTKAAFACLKRGDLLRLPYEVRDRLVITHGRSTVQEALERALDELRVDAPEGFTFADLLDALIARLECDAKGKTGSGARNENEGCGESKDDFGALDLSASWSAEFAQLLRDIEG
ncbi:MULTISPECIES: hypothetical protein [unclassified Actinomyces]|uniref:hypothetical protein n=1 Tax=unclassified Actinomyces TaxID=2609248 RepID=UPI000D59C552|nr:MULTISPECIES: hypothetical protein [unclassified Actinomyces]RAX24209.1 hypothetical protein DRB07_01980 [Actinomyces sp. Z3]